PMRTSTGVLSEAMSPPSYRSAPGRHRGQHVDPAVDVTPGSDQAAVSMSNLQIVIPLFPRFTALDGIGPYEVLQRIPTFDVTFISHQRGEVRSENGFLGITADATFDEIPRPDVIVFPGGVGTRPLADDERVLDWVRTAHETTTFTTSVCTGSIVLA